MTTPLFVLCVPVAWNSNPLPGSKEVMCSRCQEPVWMARTTPDAVRENGEHIENMEPVCLKCCESLPEKMEALPFTKAQLSEIVRAIRRDA